MARGILWAGGDPRMTGCLESPLARPVPAQSWSQTATDGACFSTTALLSGRDRPLRLCVRDGPNSEAKDSNPNPNHFILLESESESEFTQICNGFESWFES